MRPPNTLCAFEDRGGRGDLLREDLALLRQFRPIGEKLALDAADKAFAVRGVRPNIYLDFYAREEVGAASKKIGGDFFIGLSCGLPSLLSSMFSPLVDTGRPLNFLQNRAVAGLGTLRTASTEPDQADNQALTTLLCEEAIRFIFQHELAHIVNGHLGLVEEVSGVGSLNDGPPDARRHDSLDWLTRQTLEMDADSVAVSQALSRMVVRLDNSSEPFARFHSPRETLFIWCFATYVLFRHFAVTGPIFEHLDDFVHTPPQLRAFQAHGILMSCLIARKHGTSAVPSTPAVDVLLDMLSVCGEAVAITELALADVRRETVDSAPIQQALSEEARHLFFNEYRRAWSLIRPRLVPHAYLDLAPDSTQAM